MYCSRITEKRTNFYCTDLFCVSKDKALARLESVSDKDRPFNPQDTLATSVVSNAGVDEMCMVFSDLSSHL